MPTDPSAKARELLHDIGEPWCLMDHPTFRSCQYCVQSIRLNAIDKLREALTRARAEGRRETVERVAEMVKAMMDAPECGFSGPRGVLEFVCAALSATMLDIDSGRGLKRLGKHAKDFSSLAKETDRG